MLAASRLALVQVVVLVMGVRLPMQVAVVVIERVGLAVVRVRLLGAREVEPTTELQALIRPARLAWRQAARRRCNRR